jgi:GTPase
MEIYGNIHGLGHLFLRRLENLYRKRVGVAEVVSADLARTLMDLSREIGRQVGLLINRRGLVDYVIVGDRRGITIPQLSTERVGRARFRGVRLIHAHLEGELLSTEDLTDLSMLQLDLIAALAERAGEPGPIIHIAYLIPRSKAGQAWQFMGPMGIYDLDLDFAAHIGEVEAEFVKERGKHYDLDDGREKCMLVGVLPPGSRENMDERMAELEDLCQTAGLTILDSMVQKPKELNPQYLVGKGKMEEIIMRSRQLGVDLLVFDRELSPGQLVSIVSLTEMKVVDRNQLILDIFALRAETAEAKIQVELAQLRYILPRLAKKNIAFSRLTGGIGTRGPGETKLEIDRRRVREKIAFLERKLEEVRRVRDKKRERRRGSGIPVVSIVGYTNSGKSTLLNLLTKSSVGAEDRPFSTLTPTTRLIKYPERRNIILTDTVGFIKDLPQVLLKAFMATLEELEDAHLLLHLVDVSSPDFEERIETVDSILKDLHLDSKRRLLVFNKIDRVEGSLAERLESRFGALSISCLKRRGIDRLTAALEREVEAVVSDSPAGSSGSGP